MYETKLNESLGHWVGSANCGFFVTLNSVLRDRIQFEQHLCKFAHRLNGFCFGRAYERKEKRLKIVAGIETGKLNNMLHAHLAVNNVDDTRRNFHEINVYVRKHWYKLIEQNNIFGTMVDVRPITESAGAISYLTKDSPFWNRMGEHNIVFL